MTTDNRFRENPWYEEHKQRELVFGDPEVPPRISLALVDNKYSHSPAPRSCLSPACGSWTWWKSTIGCFKCPECGALSTTGGQVI